MSARKLAVQLLNRTEQEQSYSNLLLDSALSQSQLDDRDKRLCASLYYGVIERRITLDAVISHYSKQPLRKLDCTVRNILRLGIYQLLYCDQIPSRAAVNESVKLTKTCRKASASGFVNAVLRGFLRDECKVPYPKGKKAAMVVEYAVPQWLLEKLLDAYGEETTVHFWRTLCSRQTGLSGRIRRRVPVQNWNRHWEMPSVPQICPAHMSCTPAISESCRNSARVGFMCRISLPRSVLWRWAQNPGKRSWTSVPHRAERPVPLRQAWRSPAWCTPLIWRRIGSS